MHRTTPCVGICSTTYGDLVCRGCKRYAHEIVQWNGYDEGQRGAVWQRLFALRDGAVARYVPPVQAEALAARAAEFNVREDGAESTEALAYEVLRRMVMRQVPVADADSPRELLNQIDREFYQRSRAHYERNFRIPSE